MTVVADRDRLALALDALLENAIAHTASGGEIEVSARQEDGHVVLMVADSGTGGIAPADLDRIFQRFARANPQRSSETGGFGLGLAIVQAVATAHHGSGPGAEHAGPRLVVRVRRSCSARPLPRLPSRPASRSPSRS